MHRRLILLFAFLVALPLAAQRTVSRIDVRGSVPASIVTSQTALTAGRSYTERDLEIAMGRLRRLPFVFDATYTFEGDALVIEVNAVNRFFGELDARAVGFYNQGESGMAALSGGGRLFLGNGGVGEARLTQVVTDGDDGTAVDAEYSHYGIGGTRLFASAGISHSFLNEEGFEPDPTFTLTLGYPLTVRQTLTATYADAGFTTRRSIPVLPEQLSSSGNSNVLDLRWTWDTTEDPFFARSGEVIAAGPSWAERSERFNVIVVGSPDGQVDVVDFRTEAETMTVAADARKYWAHGTRGTIFGGVRAEWFDSENVTDSFGGPLPGRFDSDGLNYFATAGYGYNLFDFASHPKLRHRIEGSVTYGRRELDQPFPGSDFTYDTTELQAAYILRRDFATVRLALMYGFD